MFWTTQFYDVCFGYSIEDLGNANYKVGLMDPSNNVCFECATKSFKFWKGWPASESKKVKTPKLPKLNAILRNGCALCRSTVELCLQSIYFLNIHGRCNTGLPDYFILAIDESQNKDEAKRLQAKWGFPYQRWDDGTLELDELEKDIDKVYR